MCISPPWRKREVKRVSQIGIGIVGGRSLPLKSSPGIRA